ncbi:MAG TPA: 2,4'-dihydroxyacetophenone dioxygenase family protein [Aliidongia sp.]|uniref:2,4'-dihydroxyacetophenone dioxygenase family protein n=1 Tax=Aliidongia sp. TaxID=1914230 RepID=UPI002DDD223C|nr:2,4'-dihydroxyacetophenone dioxygenase family protein [Aliidongia sp.]HEV2677964.1 2,4'-dihydroxyacetophenone dioxygenase family protein [Aliidongia sp.]
MTKPLNTIRELSGHRAVTLPAPFGSMDELIHHDVTEDERAWLPLGENQWTRPLVLNVSQGSWVSLFKGVGAGVLERHRHTNAVTGVTLGGTWGYLERDWIARQGTFIYEPPGDTHTLFVHPEEGHMLAIFHMFGPILYVDEQGAVTGFDDVFTRTEAYLAHCREVGLGENHLRSLLR